MHVWALLGIHVCVALDRGAPASHKGSRRQERRGAMSASRASRCGRGRCSSTSSCSSEPPPPTWTPPRSRRDGGASPTRSTRLGAANGKITRHRLQCAARPSACPHLSQGGGGSVEPTKQPELGRNGACTACLLDTPPLGTMEAAPLQVSASAGGASPCGLCLLFLIT